MTFDQALVLGFEVLVTSLIIIYLIGWYFADKKENEEIEKRIKKLENSKEDDSMKKQLDYFELWDLAFKENDKFNKTYFNYYVKNDTKYKECSIVLTDDPIEDGLAFSMNGIEFTIAPYEYNNENYKIIKKFRVDSWKKVLANATNEYRKIRARNNTNKKKN